MFCDEKVSRTGGTWLENTPRRGYSGNRTLAGELSVITRLSPTGASLSLAPTTRGEGNGRSVAGSQPAPIDSTESATAQKQVQALRATDRKVRAHESAHLAAGGALTGSVSFTYRLGPDGQRYAVGGEVRIDVSPAATPEKTIAKAETIRAAALAPVDPSPQDRRVAALAEEMARAARQEELRKPLHREVEGAQAPSAGKALAAYDLEARSRPPSILHVLA